MTNTNKNNQTAAARYAELHTEASEILKQIAKQLDHHSRLQASNPDSWGYPGDLGRVRDELANALLAILGVRSAVDAKGLKY